MALTALAAFSGGTTWAAPTDAKEKQELFNKQYNYLNVLKGAISFVLKSEKEFKTRYPKSLNDAEIVQYRRFKVLQSALITGLSLRTPTSASPVPPGSTNLTIEQQLQAILKGDTNNTSNLLGSNTGLEAKVNEVSDYQKRNYKKSVFSELSEYTEIRELLGYLSDIKLIESTPLTMAA